MSSRKDGKAPRINVSIIQQGVWAMDKESLPLAAGYLKATLYSDDRIRTEADVRIHNFKGGTSLGAVVRSVLTPDPPDILAMSVFGWNIPQFAAVSETYKQLRPDGLLIWGGTHVAYQAERMTRLFPWVDVIVNGEGEFVLQRLVQAYLAHSNTQEFWAELELIPGLSLNRPEGGLHDTGEPERIADLNTIPSPFLTGAVPLADAKGEFLYDVGLIETNRGCPFKCSFCYWGGAIGQKVRAFDRERLREEVEMFARFGVESLVMCDSNFGLFKADRDFVEDVIAIREAHGYPRNIDTSWAKNKPKIFYEIVELMSQAGLHSSFTLALQTLSDDALELMRRKNMKLNDWEEMVSFMYDQRLDLYGELIWAAPGEDREKFLEGYNRLSKHTSRIAVYPLLILPNTAYFDEREELGLITVRGERDDFEYVLATKELPLNANIESQPFLLLARTLGEHMILRHTWHALRELADLPQGSALWSLGEYVRESTHPVAVELRSLLAGATVVDSAAVANALRVLYTRPDVDDFLFGWLERDVHPSVDDAATWQLLAEVFRYDWYSRPMFLTQETIVEEIDLAGEGHYICRDIPFAYPLADVLAVGDTGKAAALRRCLTDHGQGDLDRYMHDFIYPRNFNDHIDSHEQAAFYFATARTREQNPAPTFAV